MKSYLTDGETVASVSVIIPFFNAESSILRALESVRSQTVLPFEVICVNDGSTDNSATIVQNFDPQGAFRCEIVTLAKNCGVAVARNEGIHRATGTYVAFLDADDMWFANKLELQLDCIYRLGLDMIGGHSCTYGLLINSLKKQSALPQDTGNICHVRLFTAMLSNPYHTSSVLVRRDAIVKFPESGQLSEDYALWLQLISLKWKCAKHTFPLSFMFKHAYTDSGLSSKLLRMELGELKAISGIGAVHPFKAFVASIFSFIKFGVRIIKWGTRALSRRPACEDRC